MPISVLILASLACIVYITLICTASINGRSEKVRYKGCSVVRHRHKFRFAPLLSSKVYLYDLLHLLKMFLPARVSHIEHKLSVVTKNQFFIYLWYGIVQRCSPIPCIRGLHPETCCNCFKAWHSSPYDGIITGPFSRKMQSVLICC